MDTYQQFEVNGKTIEIRKNTFFYAKRDYLKLFCQFLKAHNAYVKFRANCLKQHKSDSDSDFFTPIREVNQNCLDFKTLVDLSFIWARTREGHSFWKQLNSEWKSITYILNNDKWLI